MPWIGLRENLQETMFFPSNLGFSLIGLLGLCIMYIHVYRCHDAPPPPAPAIPKCLKIL